MERNRVVKKKLKAVIPIKIKCTQCFGSGTKFNFLKSRTCAVCNGSCKVQTVPPREK